MSVRERDPEIISFASRVGVVAGALLAVVALSRILLSTATSDVRATIATESQERVRADSLAASQRDLTDRRLDRMAAIMELVVLVVADQASPAQREEALDELRRMRRVAP